MHKKFERALLLCPGQYSLKNSLHDVLSLIAGEVRTADITATMSKGEIKINTQIFRFPHSLRQVWEKRFVGKINSRVLQIVESFKPDIVLIYNSIFLVPETCVAIRKKARLLFFMGDSPFYTPQNNYYLACLNHADLILSPDSFWSKQLNTIGLNTTLYFVPAPDTSSYFRITDLKRGPGDAEHDILYVGASYLNSWGYKKALFMSRFTGFNFRIYGNTAWKRWFGLFPELKPVYTESGFLPQEKLNRMFNLTRIVPVDGNPGILNGFHLRLFEALSAGALPLVEYRHDVDNLLFRGFREQLPLIRDYNQAADIAEYYLKNGRERDDLVTAMDDFIIREYSAEANAGRLVEALK